jgi:hypothetical protein
MPLNWMIGSRQVITSGKFRRPNSSAKFSVFSLTPRYLRARNLSRSSPTEGMNEQAIDEIATVCTILEPRALEFRKIAINIVGGAFRIGGHISETT